MAPKSRANTPKCIFAIGEKVLCIDNIPLIYESHILDISMEDNKYKYFVHYVGWRGNHHEWLPKKRVLKYNKVNLDRSSQMRIKFLKHMTNIMNNEDLLRRTFESQPHLLERLDRSIETNILNEAESRKAESNNTVETEVAVAVKKTAVKKPAGKKSGVKNRRIQKRR